MPVGSQGDLSVHLSKSTFVLDFPRTADHRVYHLGLRAGEIANRIVYSTNFSYRKNAN
jgi:hypothetical protein